MNPWQASLQTTPGALRSYVSDLRSRLREIIRARVRQTVTSDDEFENEFEYLIDMWS